MLDEECKVEVAGDGREEGYMKGEEWRDKREQEGRWWEREGELRRGVGEGLDRMGLYDELCAGKKG